MYREISSDKNQVQLKLWLEFSSSLLISNSLYRSQLSWHTSLRGKKWAGVIDSITKMRKPEQYMTSQSHLTAESLATSNFGHCYLCRGKYSNSRNSHRRAREMTQQLKIFAALAEPGFSSQHPQYSLQPSVSPVSGHSITMTSAVSVSPRYVHSTHKYMQVKHTYAWE